MIDRDQFELFSKEHKSAIDEITKEKQRIGEELARMDGQRAKLVNELGELEAGERVLTRYGQSARAKDGPSHEAGNKRCRFSATACAPAPYGGKICH